MVSEYKCKIKNSITLREYFNKYGLSKTFQYKLVSLKAVSSLNKILNLDDVLENGTTIYINYSLLEDNESIPSYDYDIDILYEDNEIIAIDKKSNILVHSDGNSYKTVLNAIVHHLKDNGDDSFIRPLHRIDFDTRGVLLFAKNIFSYSNINKQMMNNEIIKKYLLLCEGIVESDSFIKVNISGDRHNSNKYAVTKNGKEAYTEYIVLKKYQKNTLIEATIKTGRTHQIRVSFAHIGHSIVGDELYGVKTIKKRELELVSKELRFVLFDKKMCIKSNIQIQGI